MFRKKRQQGDGDDPLEDVEDSRASDIEDFEDVEDDESCAPHYLFLVLDRLGDSRGKPSERAGPERRAQSG